MAQSPDCTLLCPNCANTPSRGVVWFHADDEQVTCESCKRRYRVLTGRLERLVSTPAGAGRARYEITVSGLGGRKMRVFEMKPGRVVSRGSLVTLVTYGRRVVGLADQSGQGTWYHALTPERPPSRMSRRAFNLYRIVIAALCIGQVWMLQRQLRLFPHPLALAWLVGLVAAAPAALWVVDALRAPARKADDPWAD